MINIDKIKFQSGSLGINYKFQFSGDSEYTQASEEEFPTTQNLCQSLKFGKGFSLFCHPDKGRIIQETQHNRQSCGFWHVILPL